MTVTICLGDWFRRVDGEPCRSPHSTHTTPHYVLHAICLGTSGKYSIFHTELDKPGMQKTRHKLNLFLLTQIYQNANVWLCKNLLDESHLLIAWEHATVRGGWRGALWANSKNLCHSKAISPRDTSGIHPRQC